MNTIRHILFPYDFSDQCNQALPFVHSLAGKLGATITVLHVIPSAWTVPLPGTAPVRTLATSAMEQEADVRLEASIKKHIPDLLFTHLVTSGDPAEEIMDFAARHRIDLIMMPSHGLGAFRALLLGSVTSKVLHDAKCAVWTAPHQQEQQSANLPQTVLCAIDGGPQTADLLRWATCLTARIGGTLKLLHVVPPINDWLELPSEDQIQEQLRKEARTQVDALLKSQGIDMPVRIAIGEVTDSVTQEARQECADLVVIGRGNARDNLGRLRSHTYGIIQKSPCPVLSV